MCLAVAVLESDHPENILLLLPDFSTLEALGKGALRTKRVKCKSVPCESVWIIKHGVSPPFFFISLNTLSSLQTAALVAQHAYPSSLYYPGPVINVPLSRSVLPRKA